MKQIPALFQDWTSKDYPHKQSPKLYNAKVKKEKSIKIPALLRKA